ncbi:MAG: hypothetical protein Q8Q15_02520 [bacterium]|nr:hypothetical protein [bacterium]
MSADVQVRLVVYIHTAETSLWRTAALMSLAYMISELILGTISLLATMSGSPETMVAAPSAFLVPEKQVLASHEMDLTKRLPNPDASQVFADNILLTLRYLKGDVGELRDEKVKIDWEKVREPFEASLTLEPGEVFAYHDVLLPEFQNAKVKTTNAHFDYKQGYKPFAGLIGNGVCHLATLINWVATDARLAGDPLRREASGESKRTGLEVISHVNHDFYPVPGVPRENGTSIRWNPTGGNNSRNQNLYIRNNFDYPVTFEFKADSRVVVLKIVK